jgi:hypothetical protein
VLSSEQRVKFKALHQQWDRNRRARPHEGDEDSRQHED